jgi:sterol desaturase/sphingolipid hydroxylase (fatty acid hydroxylase superfamily)
MDFVNEWLPRIERNLLAEAPAYLQLGAVFLAGILADIVRRRNLRRRYLSRAVLTDLGYTALYLSHLYELLLVIPVSRGVDAAVTTHAPWLRFNALSGTPGWVQIVASVVAVEFVTYWYHRAQHASPWLWQLHKIHHSQRELTVFTTFRVHFVDRLIVRVMLLFIPILLGAAPQSVMLVQVLLTVQLLLTHSDLGWTFGPVGRLVVSPAYHEVHHSSERRHHDRNFGTTLTIWDYLFGTALSARERATAYGLSGEEVPESFWSQLWVPAAGAGRLIKTPRNGRAGVRPIPPPSDASSSSSQPAEL